MEEGGLPRRPRVNGGAIVGTSFPLMPLPSTSPSAGFAVDTVMPLLGSCARLGSESESWDPGDAAIAASTSVAIRSEGAPSSDS